MKRILPLALVAFSLSGCAHGPKAVATNIVAASDAAADSLADSWAAAVRVQVEECRTKDLPTVQARKDCLGMFKPAETQKVIAAVQALVAVQTAVKAAAECEALDSCIADTDWAALASEVNEAWSAILPYVRAVKEQK